jgi:hypothetical protein
MLKITKIFLELLTDVEMFKMVESGIRGGISQISHRHSKANNKYMSNYDSSKNKIYKDKKTGATICKDKLDESKINEGILNGLLEVEYIEDTYIVYLDANNLYGYAMCQYLPTGDFKWNTDEWNAKKILELQDDDEFGYLFDDIFTLDDKFIFSFFSYNFFFYMNKIFFSVFSFFALYIFLIYLSN